MKPWQLLLGCAIPVEVTNKGHTRMFGAVFDLKALTMVEIVSLYVSLSCRDSQHVALVSLSVCLSATIHVFHSICSRARPPTVPVRLSVCLSVCLSVYPSIHPSNYTFKIFELCPLFTFMNAMLLCNRSIKVHSHGHVYRATWSGDHIVLVLLYFELFHFFVKSFSI